MDLEGWETFLRPFLSQVELLGEIPLEQSQHAELERALANFVQQHSLTEATRRLRADYPASFVTYLAFKAAFNDERGFWDKVAKVIGLENSGLLFHLAHHWGQTFLEIIEQHPNLRRFKGVSGLEYVTPIRLHGGIPAFSLPDFFRHILLPSVEKAPYDGMDDKSALRELLAHYTAELFVDDVVRYFFQHGGEPAQRFFSKCRQMARIAAEGKPLPDAAELGLRPYVLQVFETFREQAAEPAARRRRPRLFFAPYTPAFRILLPPQPLSLEQASSHYEGRLYDSEQIYTKESGLRARRRGTEWMIDEIEWLLEEPIASVQVGLFPHGQDKPLISYSLRLLPRPDDPPLLAFDHSNGSQQRLSPALPARVLWLFFPAGIELHFEGAVRPFETLHPFPPPWDGWQAGAWDLTKVRLVRLLKDGKDICPPIAVSASLEPALTASDLPPQATPVEEKPLYSAPPRLRLPLRDVQNPQPELEGWRLTLESRYAARPAGKWEGTAANLPWEILPEESCALISLAPWLGEAPFGTYHLTCSHRGRAAVELPFRVCAGLSIEGLQPYSLPDEKDGAPPVHFRVRLPESARLYAETADIEIGEGNQVTVPATGTAAQADLRLEIPNAPEAIQIPLRVTVPRLRWALLLQPDAALEWQHQTLTRPLPELLQADTVRSRPRLRVELPVLGNEKPLIELHLAAAGKETPLQTSESHSLTSHWVEFDLSHFFDTIRARPEESIFEFRLELLDASRNLDVFLPVLRFSRELDIRICHFELIPEGQWRLHWYEPRPLRHRRLRLWSLWQPWAAPLEIPLPDNAPASDIAPEGWWMYDFPNEFSLPLSTYRAHFVTVAPYEKNPAPDFPPPQSIEISMCQPEERLCQIHQELETATPDKAFALHFEKLCIYHYWEHTEQKQKEIEWLLAHWRDASLIHLEALARWLGQYDCVENQRAFLLCLFREETLERLEKEHHPDDFVQKYLENITSTRTVNPESARRVLRLAREPQIIVQALHFLFKAQSEDARQAFWEALEEGRFSEGDVAPILAQYPDFARALIENAPVSPLRRRLLLALSRYLDLPKWVVKTGYFVLFDAGWGQILEIQGAARADLFLPDEEQPTLLVELLHWPGQKVEINLKVENRGQMKLIGRNGAYRCNCHRFVALEGKEFQDIWNKHMKTCTQTSSRFAICATARLSNPPLYYSARPSDIFDTRPS